MSDHDTEYLLASALEMLKDVSAQRDRAEAEAEQLAKARYDAQFEADAFRNLLERLDSPLVPAVIRDLVTSTLAKHPRRTEPS